MDQDTELKRVLSLPQLLFYGLGTIVGAGIYVLVGKVAAASGPMFVYAFLVAGMVAAFTALSYAELASRYPQSAGAALYVDKGFGRPFLSRIVGWMVIATGLVSAAAIVNGFHGYLSVFVEVPQTIVQIGLALFLTAIAIWGIAESAALITFITLAELAGLAYVLIIGMDASPVQALPDAAEFHSSFEGGSLLLGAFLAFYAFIGFEDMVNVVEEVKNPRRNLPIAILASVALAMILYTAVAFVAKQVLPLDLLSESAAPLALLVEKAGADARLISAVSLIAVVNGALVQVIMASRVIYGMGRKHLAPSWLATIGHRTQTPIRATVIVGAIVLALALWMPLETLASITSFIMLFVFMAVNLALVLIKHRKETTEGFSTPVQVPFIGLFLCAALIAFKVLG